MLQAFPVHQAAVALVVMREVHEALQLIAGLLTRMRNTSLHAARKNRVVFVSVPNADANLTQEKNAETCRQIRPPQPHSMSAVKTAVLHAPRQVASL